MVAETTFAESSGGRVMASGTKVLWSGQGNNEDTNHQVAVSRGVTKMSFIADRLQLSSQVQDAGRRMYELAVQMNFNVGRPSRFVACACLYVVCRRSHSPHLLIDFADVLQTPVKTLGRIYVLLLRRLVGGAAGEISVPMIDPSLFIERFSRQLDIGNSQRKVQTAANRIIQFMHRDWICVGRRPNGLCGAALYVAACYHGIKVEAKQIADIVRMSENTLKIRLLEMRQTPMASLTPAEFEHDEIKVAIADEGQQVLPPCMRRRLHKEKLKALEDERREQDQRKALPDPQRPEPLANEAAPNDEGSHPLPLLDGTVQTSANGGALAAGSSKMQIDKFTASTPSGDDIEAVAREITQALLARDGAPLRDGGPGLDAMSRGGSASAQLDKIIAAKASFEGGDGSDAESAAGKQPAAAKAGTGAPADDGANVETLSDVDDDALSAYILDEEEAQNKSDIWHEVNKDYLEEWHVRGQEARRKRKFSDDAASSKSGRSGRSSKGGKRTMFPPAASAAHSAAMAMIKKGKVGATRINFEALQSLFD